VVLSSPFTVPLFASFRFSPCEVWIFSSFVFEMVSALIPPFTPSPNCIFFFHFYPHVFLGISPLRVSSFRSGSPPLFFLAHSPSLVFFLAYAVFPGLSSSPTPGSSTFSSLPRFDNCCWIRSPHARPYFFFF